MTQQQSRPTGSYREIADLTETERHRLLASERRRILTTILSTNTPPVDLETLAEQIVDRDVAIESADDAVVDRMTTVLRHKHLPVLSDMGLIEFDADTNQVEFAGDWSY
ncbi:MAG: DUF7344 domain-containing protein [Halovenus sp.]